MTPLESDGETDSKVKKLAMKFDQSISGRQSVESTGKEYFGIQPQTEDNTRELFLNVLEVITYGENTIMFEENRLSRRSRQKYMQKTAKYKFSSRITRKTTGSTARHHKEI